MNKPHINVTPLIDVLLVLLIIFMVVAPLKPTTFKARIPEEPINMDKIIENPYTLVVSINPDGSLRLNKETDMGAIETPEKLIQRLREVFRARTENGVISENLAANTDLPFEDRIEKTVFIKAPRTLAYGNVAKVVDAVKLAGASPISLQIDDLD